MTTPSLANIPQDTLLLITDLLEPEDCLQLVQIGAHDGLHIRLRMLNASIRHANLFTTCGKMLQLRRRVHYLPLEQLEIPQLRAAILHTLKLDLKWSGREGIDSSPTRHLEIDPCLHLGLPAESRGVTWVWFLEDGIHLTCVVDDTVVQLWNLRSNKPILSFDVGGCLMRASQYSDDSYFLIAGSFDPKEGSDGEAVLPAFAVWKYRWDTIDFVDQLSPMALHTLPVHPTSILLNEAVVGAVYTEDPANFPAVENLDETGYITFLLMEWKEVCRPIRIFTPMGFFDGDHAHEWKKDLAHCVRTSTHFSILFDTAAGVVVYAYDWTTISRLVVQPPDLELPCPKLIHPRLKVTYELFLEQPAPSVSVQDAWSHACLLWDGQKVGILGYHISEDLSRPLLSLSVLDLSPLLVHDDGIPNYDLQGEYLRRYADDGTSSLSNYTTKSNSFLGSQPRNATNTTWVLKSWDGPNVMSALALARYMPQEALQTGDEIKTPHAIPLKIMDAGVEIPATQQPLTEPKDLETKRKEQFLQISLEGWIPQSEQAEDIDLDDRLGRVVFGMNSGKVYILEFV